MEARAQVNYVRISPRKVKIVLDPQGRLRADRKADQIGGGQRGNQP